MNAKERRRVARQRTELAEAIADRDAIAKKLAEIVAERHTLATGIEDIRRMLAKAAAERDAARSAADEVRKLYRAEIDRTVGLEHELEQLRAQLAPLEADNKKLRGRLRRRERDAETANANRKAAGL